ncbi:MAG: dTMP kinase [Alphaproteobacteria bacterium]|mgnify:FL=1|jgi:dTMP kinase|nr:dTMP kinase [Alphaproteobacteria bacterium]MBT4911164.1 dTMP kinase [Alphaproteobacteria bacterium]MBT5662469.1 dTMP kinase [Alphaproteobacteria bacterium]
MKNYFITFEGGEGSGKSTQIDFLSDFLKKKGAKVLSTREPGGTPSAEIIRDLVTKGDPNKWTPLTESLLMWASRTEHVEKLIRPSLEDGKWVLCDRFYHSTYAYQGIGHNLGIEKMQAIKNIVLGDFKPDLTFVLDIDPLVGIERTKKRNSDEDRFEKMNIDFHNKLRHAFIEISKEDPHRFVLIDGELDTNSIFEIISNEVMNRFIL